MEKLTFQSQCKIIRKTEHGFTALEKEYLIKFEDSKYTHYFKVGDLIQIEMENVSEAREDIIRDGYSVFYIQIKNYTSNGISFNDVGSVPATFFWSFRGFITNEIFEEVEPYELESILKITFRKLDIPVQ